MNVTFCGHSQITKADNIANWLRNVTQDLIEQGATTFYLGGYGEFDSLAASILREQKKKYPQIELVLVLAYLNTGRDVSGYDSTVYPPLENVPRRFSISHRNRWMVESADVVVAMFSMIGAEQPQRYGVPNRKRSRLFHIVMKWAAEVVYFAATSYFQNC